MYYFVSFHDISSRALVLVLMHVGLPKLLAASDEWLHGASYIPKKNKCKTIHWHNIVGCIFVLLHMNTIIMIWVLLKIALKWSPWKANGKASLKSVGTQPAESYRYMHVS